MKRKSGTDHPVVGRYAFFSLYRTMGPPAPSGHRGGVIRAVDWGPQKGLRAVVVQLPGGPQMITAKTWSARCRGQEVRLVDRELKTLRVVMGRRRVSIFDLVTPPKATEPKT